MTSSMVEKEILEFSNNQVTYGIRAQTQSIRLYFNTVRGSSRTLFKVIQCTLNTMFQIAHTEYQKASSLKVL